jgi:4-hydroxy-tetrahydrodipicolinate reductase
MIPHVLNSRPGLKSMIDLPVPRAIMGDMRDLLEE